MPMPAEMSGLWNFPVRVQSWSDKIESDPVVIRKIFQNHQSDPVLIRQCKIMYFYFASWGKRTTEAILPLLIRQCKIMYFYFASWGKRTTEAILPLAKYDCFKAKYFQQCFCPMRQNRHRLLALPKFSKEVFIRHQRQ